jgi:hypothetical protein
LHLVIVYAIVDSSSPAHVLGDAVDVFVRREDAERFIEEVRGDDPEIASYGSRSASSRRAGGTRRDWRLGWRDGVVDVGSSLWAT